jgi:hypothetical protein
MWRVMPGRASETCRVAQLRPVIAGAALVYLAVSEWVVWTRPETVQVSPSNMGTGLFVAFSNLLVLQVLALLAFGVLTRGLSLMKRGWKTAASASGPTQLIDAASRYTKNAGSRVASPMKTGR